MKLVVLKDENEVDNRRVSTPEYAFRPFVCQKGANTKRDDVGGTNYVSSEIVTAPKLLRNK